jgi:hypothetical protein
VLVIPEGDVHLFGQKRVDHVALGNRDAGNGLEEVADQRSSRARP